MARKRGTGPVTEAMAKPFINDGVKGVLLSLRQWSVQVDFALSPGLAQNIGLALIAAAKEHPDAPQA